MKIDPKVWQALRRAAERDDQRTYEQLLTALVDAAVCDERGRQAARLPVDAPYLRCHR